LIIAIASDQLFPVEEQRLLSDHIPGAAFESVPSEHGHDGFLIETECIQDLVQHFLETNPIYIPNDCSVLNPCI
jgi:homoserine O-acetyltransferase